MRTTADAGRAQDAVQETLLRAWRHPEALEPERGDPRPWLLRTLRNVLIDDWRSRAARPEVLSDDPAGTAPPAGTTAVDHADAAVQAWTVASALARLSPEHRAVVVECYYRGRTVSEAALALGIPPGTVKSRAHYAAAGIAPGAGGDGGRVMSCRHRFDVAVYALGALDPGEREAFERHLAGCADCTRSLAEVAGLPGLLAHAAGPGPVADGGGPPAPTGDPAGPPDVDDAAAGPSAPVLDHVLRRVRRRRRTERVLAACAVVAALFGGLAVASILDRPGVTAPPVPSSRELALPSTAGSESSGLAGLTTRPWGTQVVLTCRYDGAPRPAPPADAPRTVYLLVVRAPDGQEQQIARWSPPPGQDVVVTAATDLPPDRVSGLEVRTVGGDVVMRS